MYLVQKNHIRKRSKEEYQILKYLARLSKNLYNVTLWTLRQYYEKNGTYLNYPQAYHLVKDNENYAQLPSQTAQQTIKTVDRSFKSYFSLLKKKQQGKYNRPAKIPHYLPKDGYFICVFPKDQFKIKGDQIRLSLGMWFRRNMHRKFLNFYIPPNVKGHVIKEIRLIPRYQGRYFEIEFVYLKDLNRPNLMHDRYIGIDLGLGNFATCYSSIGTSFILEGQGFKSYNRWWNKQKAQLQSIYDLQGIKFGKKMAKLLFDRKNKMRNFMAQNVNYLVKHCLEHRIGQIIIGELIAIKQNIHLGKKTNQHFQYITYGLFKQKLRAKCDLYGITYHEVDEAYTSQTCSVCNERKKSNRKHRGLYLCNNCGMILNADSNGARNIVKKVAPHVFDGGSRGVLNTPVRVRLPV